MLLGLRRDWVLVLLESGRGRCNLNRSYDSGSCPNWGRLTSLLRRP